MKTINTESLMKYMREQADFLGWHMGICDWTQDADERKHEQLLWWNSINSLMGCAHAAGVLDEINDIYVKARKRAHKHVYERLHESA